MPAACVKYEFDWFYVCLLNISMCLKCLYIIHAVTHACVLCLVTYVFSGQKQNQASGVWRKGYHSNMGREMYVMGVLHNGERERHETEAKSETFDVPKKEWKGSAPEGSFESK